LKIPEEIKDFFYFTKGERNGIFGLIILILLIIIVPKIFLHHLSETKTNAEAFKKEILAFENSLYTKEKENYKNRLDKYIEARYDTLNLFYFDPNITSDESFKKLGLTDKQITTIHNYLKKGGKFYIKDDFRKIYGIRQNQYLKLKPYILLADEVRKKENSLSINQKENNDSLFYFDPNTLSAEKFKLLGLNDKQIKTIENYRNKGGVFYKKEDFKKIYGINNETYNKLAPFIKIEDKKESLKDIIPIEPIDINTANYDELINIKGIGDYLAKNIIWYREKLGGYIDKRQLLEIKNFRKTTFELIKSNIFIDTKKIKKININFAEINDLAKHPYLNYSKAKAIVNYRTKNGAYTSTNLLLEKKILPKETFEKIKKYLTVH